MSVEGLSIGGQQCHQLSGCSSQVCKVRDWMPSDAGYLPASTLWYQCFQLCVCCGDCSHCLSPGASFLKTPTLKAVSQDAVGRKIAPLLCLNIPTVPPWYVCIPDIASSHPGSSVFCKLCSGFSRETLTGQKPHDSLGSLSLNFFWVKWTPFLLWMSLNSCSCHLSGDASL